MLLSKGSIASKVALSEKVLFYFNTAFLLVFEENHISFKIGLIEGDETLAY